jgi:hypothetical protein
MNERKAYDISLVTSRNSAKGVLGVPYWGKWDRPICKFITDLSPRWGEERTFHYIGHWDAQPHQVFRNVLHVPDHHHSYNTSSKHLGYLRPCPITLWLTAPLCSIAPSCCLVVTRWGLPEPGYSKVTHRSVCFALSSCLNTTERARKGLDKLHSSLWIISTLHRTSC